MMHAGHVRQVPKTTGWCPAHPSPQAKPVASASRTEGSPSSRFKPLPYHEHDHPPSIISQASVLVAQMRIMHPVASWTITGELRTRHLKAWLIMERHSAWMPEHWSELALCTLNACFAASGSETPVSLLSSHSTVKPSDYTSGKLRCPQLLWASHFYAFFGARIGGAAGRAGTQ
jgi:hypothetical protein